MGDLFSGALGDSGEGSSGGGFGGFLRGMGTGFVNGRLGPSNGFTGGDPMAKLFSSLVNENSDHNTSPNDPFATTSPLVQPGVVPAPRVSTFGSLVPSTPNAQWGSDAWGSPQG